jgi:L-cysteine desulfidase
MPYSVKDILRLEVAPALGCTEPVAIALAAAAAASLLPGQPVERLCVRLDPNVYKNGLAAAIPVMAGLSGLDMAAALGALGGDPARGLEVLEPADEGHVAAARDLLARDVVRAEVAEEARGLYVEVRLESGGNTAEAVIREMHNNIACLRLNGRDVADSPLLAEAAPGRDSGLAALEEWLRGISLERLLAFVDDLDEQDLAFLEEGVRVNLRLAEHGLEHASGLAVGRTLQDLAEQGRLQRDMVLAAKILASAAADARMAGAKLPAMSSAGSGNHGLTAILPIQAVAEHLGLDRAQTLHAVGLSHIVTAYVKAYTGRLSALCGCSVAAGAGAAAGVARLLGADASRMGAAVTILIEDLAGVICDGAKAGCALKLATAAGSAVQAALFAMQGMRVQATDGIIGRDMEQTTRNLGALSTQGMVEADRTILRIMVEKQFLPAD